MFNRKVVQFTAVVVVISLIVPGLVGPAPLAAQINDIPSDGRPDDWTVENKAYTSADSSLDTCAVRIMPLGDSITHGRVGSTSEVGYRRALWHALDSLGYNIDFVGGLTTGLATDFDRDHEGHEGWLANQIRDSIGAFLAANHPDILILHIGTNDVSSGQPAAGIASEIDDILTRIYDFDRGIVVVLGRIISRTGTAEQIARTSDLNHLLQDIVERRLANGDDIVVANLENALVYPGDMHDSVHPNNSGYDKMAGEWLRALETVLPIHCSVQPAGYLPALFAAAPPGASYVPQRQE